MVLPYREFPLLARTYDKGGETRRAQRYRKAITYGDSGGRSMKRWIASIVTMTTLLGIGLTIFPAVAEDDNKLSVPVAFGRGLNTAQPGNLVNHVIMPNAIDTKLDGVVHFLVAGFHQIVVYKPGTQPEDPRTRFGDVYQRPEQQVLRGDQSGRGAWKYAGDPG